MGMRRRRLVHMHMHMHTHTHMHMHTHTHTHMHMHMHMYIGTERRRRLVRAVRHGAQAKPSVKSTTHLRRCEESGVKRRCEVGSRQFRG